MRQVTIGIASCARCPHQSETTIPAANAAGVLSECRREGRLIQRPDEETDFPAWCPLPTA